MNGLVKRGRLWHFDFWFKKTRHQGSTHLTNHEKAKLFLSAYRTNLAMTGVGLVQKEPAPILSVFLETSFLDDVRQHAKVIGTRKFYEQRVKVLCSYGPFKQLPLDKVGELSIQGYKEFRLGKKLAVSTINAELRVLRKAMLFAAKCKLCDRPSIRSLPGEKSREFVLTGEMEKLYLSLAPYPLKQAAILMLDLGLRPGEVVALRKADIDWMSVSIAAGKTANARRSLPQTERTREVFELCFALYPDSPWVFPGNKGGHYSRISLGALHVRLRDSKPHTVTEERPARKPAILIDAMQDVGMSTNANFPREFVLHSLRHTFGTRLAESGASVFQIKSAMGHSSVKVSERYIHPSSEDISLAFKRKEMLDKLMRGEVVAHLEGSEKLKTS